MSATTWSNSFIVVGTNCSPIRLELCEASSDETTRRWWDIFSNWVWIVYRPFLTKTYLTKLWCTGTYDWQDQCTILISILKYNAQFFSKTINLIGTCVAKLPKFLKALCALFCRTSHLLHSSQRHVIFHHISQNESWQMWRCGDIPDPNCGDGTVAFS